MNAVVESERNAIACPDKLGTGPMAVDGINKWTPSWKAREIPRVSRLARDGTAEPVSREQIIRRERGQDKNIFS